MEIHIGNRVADVTLVSKEGNKVQFMIDGNRMMWISLWPRTEAVPSCTMAIPSMPN